MKKTIYLLFVTLLIGGCSARIFEKKNKTTFRKADSLIVIPESTSSFLSAIPPFPDSVVLTDKKTKRQLIVKESPIDTTGINNIDSLSGWSIIDLSKFVKTKTAKKKVEKEYAFRIVEPEKKIPIKINEKIVEENKTITTKETPWYYKFSLNFVIFIIVAAILLFLLKSYIVPWFQKR